MVDTFFGKVISFNCQHPKKAYVHIQQTLSGISTEVFAPGHTIRVVAFLSYKTPSEEEYHSFNGETVISSRLPQPEKTSFPISATFADISIEDN